MFILVISTGAYVASMRDILPRALTQPYPTLPHATQPASIQVFFIISFFLYIYRPPGCSLEFRFNNLQPFVRVLVTLENIQFRHLIDVTVMTSLLTTGNS